MTLHLTSIRSQQEPRRPSDAAIERAITVCFAKDIFYDGVPEEGAEVRIKFDDLDGVRDFFRMIITSARED